MVTPATPAPSVARRAAAAVVLTTLLAAFYFGTYHECLGTFFFLDDYWVMAAASRVHIERPWDVLQLFAPSHTGFLLYRPVSTTVYFWLLRETVGYHPTGYHAAQLAFQVVNALLVYAIAGHLLPSRPAAMMTSLAYAAAPGHALAACWVALFTVTGTAFFYFLALRVWLGRPSRWHVPAVFALFVVAVLASELALSLPLALTLADLVLEPRRDWRRLVRRQAPFYVAAGVYVAAKAYLFSYLLPGAARRPGMEGSFQTTYGLTFDATEVVRHLGYYVGYTVSFAYGVDRPNPFGIVSPTQQACALALGALVLALAVATIAYVLARPQARQPLRVVTFGLGLFVVALGPVLVLRAHLFSFYVGVAGLGMALALVAVLGVLPWGAGIARAALVGGLLAVHVSWTAPLVREERLPSMFRQLSADAARWLYTIDAATAGATVQEVVVPVEGSTVNMFERCDAHRLFLCASYPVRVVADVDQVPPAPGRIILHRPEELPAGLDGSWEWLGQACARRDRPAGGP